MQVGAIARSGAGSMIPCRRLVPLPRLSRVTSPPLPPLQHPAFTQPPHPHISQSRHRQVKLDPYTLYWLSFHVGYTGPAVTLGSDSSSASAFDFPSSPSISKYYDFSVYR